MTSAKSSTKRKAAERAAKRKAGLVPMEVWTRPEDKQAVRRYAERLNRRAARRAAGGLNG